MPERPSTSLRACVHACDFLTHALQVGTINYMSPEALAGTSDSEFKQSRKSDVWSLGCILYQVRPRAAACKTIAQIFVQTACVPMQMVYGKTPFHHIKNIMAKMRAITNEKHEIKFSDECRDTHLIDTLKVTWLPCTPCF